LTSTKEKLQKYGYIRSVYFSEHSQDEMTDTWREKMSVQ